MNNLFEQPVNVLVCQGVIVYLNSELRTAHAAPIFEESVYVEEPVYVDELYGEPII